MAADFDIDFVAFQVLTAAQMDTMADNDRALQDGSGFDEDIIKSKHIDWADTGGGDAGGIWWEELGRTTLASAGDTISVTGLPARKYIKIVAEIIESGAITGFMRFNNDSGNNYAYRASYNGAADSGATSQSSLAVFAESNSFAQITAEILNVAAREKLMYLTFLSNNTNGAGNNTVRGEYGGKWANTSDAISRIDIINSNTGDFAIGSELVVLGHN